MYYDYYEAVKDDVKQWIEENEDITEYDGPEEFKEHLNDILWTEDAVTGNGSGSYTFSAAEAGEYLAQNFDLLYEAIDDFGGNYEILKDGPEACDVTIRCHLLPQAIDEVVDEMDQELGMEED